jgi:redox-sensitive bicupin YhaK (pirin superfamily)
MIRVRPANERGATNWGWLDSRHSFSFADYYDPRNLNFRSLRVINDDRVAAGAGFGTHPHRDMEILTWVVEGAIEHKDSMGNGTVIRPGEMQRMTAGTGITHSEFNPDKKNSLRLLQVWILPERKGLQPGYQQKEFVWNGDGKKLKLVASPDAREGSITIHQDALVYVARLENGDKASHPLAPGRHAWVQVSAGSVVVNGQPLKEGDGAALSEEQAVEITANEKAEVLVFDLA